MKKIMILVVSLLIVTLYSSAVGDPYADVVLSYTEGEGVNGQSYPDYPLGPHNDPTQALGVPDETNTNADPILYVSLGNGGSIELGFADNIIIDGLGSDVQVVELGAGEGGTAYISNDFGATWTSLGTFTATSSFDLDGSGLTWANAIKIVDDGDGSTTFPYMGLDIDGVVALNSLSIILVDIDIKPGSFPNSINPNAHGVIPVAILTTEDFDASTVDPETVQLEGSGARGKGKSGNYGSMEDVDGDGDLDLVVQIENTIIWDTDATQAILTGNLKIEYGSTLIQGADSVNIVPPE